MTPCVRFKQGVRLVPTPAGARLLAAFWRGADRFQEDWLVSCGAEAHPPGDPHTLGEAFDLSVNAWSPDQTVERYHWLVAELGPLFYIQYERPDTSVVPELAAIEVVSPGATAPHIHAQRAKGTVYPPV